MIRDWNEYFSRDREVSTALSDFIDFIDVEDTTLVVGLLRQRNLEALRPMVCASEQATFIKLYEAACAEVVGYA